VVIASLCGRVVIILKVNLIMTVQFRFSFIWVFSEKKIFISNFVKNRPNSHYWLSNVFITNGNGFKTQCSYVIWHIADLTILLKHARKKYHISCNVLWSWINLQCNTYKDNTQFTMKFQIKMVISPPCTISDSIVNCIVFWNHYHL
jgi:hypothetical protein